MQDYKLDENTGDYVIEDGDIAIEDSEANDIALNLSASPGDWKQWPLLGPALIDDLGSNENLNSIKRKVSLSLEMDKYKLKTFDVDGIGNIIVDAER